MDHRVILASALAGGLMMMPCAAVQGQGSDWPSFGSDPGATKYSSLTVINRANVTSLVRAWSWKVNETTIRKTDSTLAARPGNFQATPLMIRDTLYFSTPYNRVVAMHAASGEVIWTYDPEAYKAGQPSNGTGFVHRGVAAWSDGHSRRIFMNSRWNLIALDAATGKPIRTFGDTGVVDLVNGLRRSVNRVHYTNTSPPVVVGNLVIVGNGVGDRLVYKRDPPGDVQAFDVRTGKRVWIFHTIPDSAEFGVNTWENDSWRTTGHTNVWAPFSVDDKRGLVYLPVSTPSNDWYGGNRLGDNLFAESIVCLDARTGQRKWHYQMVHHGLWDYDPPAPPVLATITVKGKRIDAVAVPTKMGYLFVFDRVTGKPVWPIVERAAPTSDVPGERVAQTQPVPTLPAPFAMQGFTESDVVDFTPALKARALDILRRYRIGPLYTPPSLPGTVVMPGAIGGAGWGGGAFDPESGTIYIKASNSPALYRIFKTASASDTVDASYMVDLAHSSLSVSLDPPSDTAAEHQAPVMDVPIVKPPYGTLTAIDLNTGARRWQVTLGDAPEIRRHPSLRGVALPPLLGVAGAPGAIVTKGGLLFASGGGSVLYGIDKTTGATLWSADLGKRAYSVPMTYRTRDGRQLVVIAAGAGNDAELIAFALPSRAQAQRARGVSAEMIDSIVHANFDGKGIVGLSVGVMQHGTVVLAKGYGMASLERKVPVTNATTFPIGSVTKQFTCSTVLLLEQDGKLSMSDRVAKYFPALTRAREIALRDLGGMTAGYRDYYPLDYVDTEMRADVTASEILSRYAMRPLDFDPRTRWSYSNTNFAILGAVAERVSGKSLGALMQQRIFGPVGMTHTTFDPPTTGAPMATGYRSWALADPTPAQPEGKGWTGAAGAIWSTPTDLLAWDLALVTGKVLGPNAYRTLTTPQRLVDGRSTGYGCGERITDAGPAITLSHGGAVSGSVTANTVLPATRSAVVLLANSETGLGELSNALVAALLPQADLPAIAGLPALEAAKTYLSQLAAGKVDRSTLSADFNAHLTPALEAAAAASLTALGGISNVQVVSRRERGGMEVAVLRLLVGNVPTSGTMYRTPDGKIQQVLITRQ